MAGGRPIDIEITTNVDGVVTGAEKVADSFDEVQDSLKDTAKASDKATKDIEDGVKDAAKVIDRDLTKALKEVDDTAKTSGKNIGKSVKDGTDKAGEGMSELADESKSTAKEAAASFGSIEDAAGALQEVAANAFAGFGPAGMAAGIIAAAGIGLAMSALTDSAEKINENKENMLDLAQTIRDNGGVLTESDYIQQMDAYGYAIQDTKEWFEIFQSDAISGFEKLKKASDETGLSAREIFKGGFGNAEEAKKTLELVNEKLEETKGKAEALYNLDGSIEPVDSNAISTLEDYKKQVEQNIRAQEVAAEIEKERKKSIEGTTQAVKEDIAALEKRSDVMKGSITSELDYLDGLDDLTEKLQTSGNAWDTNTQAGRDNQRAVIDVANDIESMAQAQLDAGVNADVVTARMNSQADALATKLAPAFGGSEEAARQYIDQVLKTPKETKTTVKLEGIPEAEAKVRAFIGTPRNMAVHMAPDGSAVENYIRTKQGTKIYVDIAPRNGVGITN